MGNHSVKPGRGWYVFAALMILTGIALIPAAILISVLGGSKPTSFIVPGSREFNLTEPGKYVLWHHYQTIFEGKTYSGSTLPNGLQMQLSNVTARTIVPLVPDQSTTVTSGSDSRRSVATFTVTNAGRYIVSVQGTSPQMVFSFGKSEFGRIATGIVAAVILAPALIISGLAIGIWVFVSRQRRMAAAR